MTIDPVLAQGITIGMEDAADISRSIEQAWSITEQKPLLDAVKEELIKRHQKKRERLRCLLLTTNVVQQLAQPSDRLSGYVARFVLRPLVAHFVPDSIKRNAFHWVMNYSLGLSKKIMQ
jgi:hypothetical protein